MKQSYIFGLMIILLASLLPLYSQSAWQNVSAAGMTFEYRITADGQDLEGKISGETTGWVAVGFNPTSVMRNANIIIGYVTTANVMIRDDWGTSNTSHASDISLGGSSNVELIEGTETGGITTIHFTIPLNSGDSYDQVLQAGQSYPIILARGANGADNFSGMHADAGTAQINLIEPVSNDDQALAASPGSYIIGNYPNPFNPTTNIRLYLASSDNAQITI
ncbi:MAG: DOMON domain-containing protein, partial [Candidatus Cloacimonadaceae bacterium]|nr:DOMON domain-containing protein [Candidatus Cloacimonadaceae bacterium]